MSRGGMRFGDLVWPVIGLAWLLALLPALASIALGDDGRQSGPLAHLGTLVLTPAMFAPLYWALLATAWITGWPRRPTAARPRPKLAFAATAVGLSFGFLLVAFLAMTLSGDVAMNDFCHRVFETPAAGPYPAGLTLHIDGTKPLTCVPDFAELGFIVLVVGLPLSIVAAVPMLLAYGIAISAGLALDRRRRPAG